MTHHSLKPPMLQSRMALALVATLAIAAPAYAHAQTDADPGAAVSDPTPAQQSNPFYGESPLPLHYPQFDKIKDSDFAPAFDRGMADHLAEIDSIANNPDAPTFDNTILAMEKSGRLLDRASTVFYSLVGADTNDVREKLRAEYAPKFSAYSDKINLNPKLFARVNTLYKTRGSLELDPSQLRLVEKYHDDFVRAGADLSDADKARLKQMNSELAELGTKFSQNVLAEVNESAVVVDSKEQLAGLADEKIKAGNAMVTVRAPVGGMLGAPRPGSAHGPHDASGPRRLQAPTPPGVAALSVGVGSSASAADRL